MLNLSSLSTQSLASCVNYFVWNCLTCFSNTKIGSVTSFSILFNFQGPVAPQPSGWQLNYFTTEVVFCQALFFRSFSFLTELGASRKPLAFLPDFLASIGSFRFTSSWVSEVILLSQRLALKYNTTSPSRCQHFFTSFFKFFRADWNRLHPLVFFRRKTIPSLYRYRSRGTQKGIKNPPRDVSCSSIGGLSKDIVTQICSGD